MGVVPLVAFDKLWMISNTAAWSSTDGLHWKRSGSDAGWGERYGMPGVFFKNRIWKMGGMEKSWDNFKNDVWFSTDGVHWKRATPRAGWSPRRGHVAVVFNGKLWVLGGAESSGRRDQLPTRALSDVWSSTDGMNWERATASAPWSGSNNVVVFQDKMWVIGGRGAWSSDDGRVWTKAVSGAAWLDRGGNGAAGCLVFDGKIWVFGGMDGRGTLNDVWSSSDGVHWQQSTASAPWAARGAEHSVVFQNKLWIYGGKTGRADVEDGFGSDVWYMVAAEQRLTR